VHPGRDKLFDETADHHGVDAAGRVDRRHQIGKDAVKVGF